jgi:hypothetical protein
MSKGFAFCVLAFTPALVAAQSIVCAGKIINEGTTQAEVAAKCGTPVQVDRRSVYNGTAAALGGQPNVINGTATEVQIEVWTYNFGPSRLMQRIRFEDGRVVRIESLGYGF